MSNRSSKAGKPNKPHGKQSLRKGKTRTWTLPTVLGLILSTLGALGVVALRPQLSASALEQLASNQPFTAPFEITNTGYLDIHVDNVTVIWPRVQYATLVLDQSSENEASWDNFDLGRGGSKTIVASLANGMPKEANAVVAVDYEYFGMKGRRMFQFVGLHRERWQWSKQPIGNLETEFNKQVDYSLRKHFEGMAN